jgi:hypothetical protein
MNIIDVYWFFITKAILNSNNNLNYWYDSKTDSLFRLGTSGDFRDSVGNVTLYDLRKHLYIVLEKQLKVYVARIENNDPYIHQLPKISDNRKKEFLENYLDTLPDENTKSTIRRHVQWDNLDSIWKDLPKNKESYELNREYGKNLYEFLRPEFETMYYPLGMTEATNVIW